MNILVHLPKNKKNGEIFAQSYAEASRLKHKHIERIYGTGKTNEYFYIIKEHITGENLESRLTQHDKLTTKETINIATAIASALCNAHQSKLFHGELDPENIFYDQENKTVKVSGIGLLSKNKINKGTRLSKHPHNVSPEEITGDALDIRSDIYCLGTILYRAIVGSPPFRGAVALVLRGHQKETPQNVCAVIKSTPIKLGAIIEKCLAKSPDNRYQTPEELLCEIKELELNLKKELDAINNIDTEADSDDNIKKKRRSQKTQRIKKRTSKRNTSSLRKKKSCKLKKPSSRLRKRRAKPSK